MSAVTITVENHETACGHASRVVSFPDGLPRFITLEQRHWATLDRLHDQNIWPAYEPAATVLEHVHTCTSDPVQREASIHYWFQLLIQAGMADVATVGGAAANEPLPRL